MTISQSIPGPISGKCQQHMAWTAQHIVDSKPIQVFRCETCDRYATELLKMSGIAAPPSLLHTVGP